MTDWIDTYLLAHGMEKNELCAIQQRRLYYAGIGGAALLTMTFIALIALGIQPPLG